MFVLAFGVCVGLRAYSAQSAVIDAKLPLVITHSPGFMFVTDIYNRELREDL